MPNNRACSSNAESAPRDPTRAGFGQILHRPRVVFVTQRAEQPFPKALFPADVLRAGVEPGGLGLENARGRPRAGGRSIAVHPIRTRARNICRANFRETGAGFALRATSQVRPTAHRATWSNDNIGRRAGRRARRRPKPRGAGHFGNSDCGRARARASCRRANLFPRRPSAARHRRFESPRPKIRSAFGIGEAGVKNPDRLSVGGFEPVPAQALMQPDGLEQTFGRQVIFVAQDIRRAQSRAPESIEAVGQRETS